jgi:hypothetical protein
MEINKDTPVTTNEYPLNLVQGIFAGLTTYVDIEGRLARDFDLAVEYMLRSYEEDYPVPIKILRARYAEGLSFGEIAKKMCLKEDSVRREFHEALLHLRFAPHAQFILYGFDEVIRKKEKLAYDAGVKDARAALLAEENDAQKTDEHLNCFLKDITLADMQLSVRAYNCLRRAHIQYASQIAKMSYRDLRNIRCMGSKTIDEVVSKMKALGYDTSAMEPPAQANAFAQKNGGVE